MGNGDERRRDRDADRHRERADDDVEVRGLGEELFVGRQRGRADDLGGELVDGVDALREQCEQRAQIDGAEPKQRRHEEQTADRTSGGDKGRLRSRAQRRAARRRQRRRHAASPSCGTHRSSITMFSRRTTRSRDALAGRTPDTRAGSSSRCSVAENTSPASSFTCHRLVAP